MKQIICLYIAVCLGCVGFAQVKKTSTPTKTAQKPATKIASQTVKKDTLVEITTDFGTMVVKLYDSTPLHKQNFLHLVQTGFYDSLLFHRVINGFMIQGGDPTSKNADTAKRIGSGSAPGERIPAEFKPYLFHKKGAIAAARDNNPLKASSNCQFYIVQGKIIDSLTLETHYANRVKPANPDFTYSEDQRKTYATIGGTPFLDQNYTVFGELVSGFEVLDKIAAVPTGRADRPLENVIMKMKLIIR